MFLSTSEVIKWFEPDQEKLWIVQFLDGPGPFQENLPAVDVSCGLWSLTQHEKKVGNIGLAFPEATSLSTLSITLYDDVQIPLTLWLEEWVNSEILSSWNGCVRTIKAVSRKVIVTKLDRAGNAVKIWKYMITPDGENTYRGNTGSGEARQFVVDFRIVGEF